MMSANTRKLRGETRGRSSASFANLGALFRQESALGLGEGRAGMVVCAELVSRETKCLPPQRGSRFLNRTMDMAPVLKRFGPCRRRAKRTFAFKPSMRFDVK